jgi:hypothetical protein
VENHREEISGSKKGDETRQTFGIIQFLVQGASHQRCNADYHYAKESEVWLAPPTPTAFADARAK